MFTDGRQQRQPNDKTTTYCRLSGNIQCGCIMIGFIFVVVRQLTQYVVVLSLGCRCCRLSVNTICGRIMVVLQHIVFTDRRQHRQPNHNTTTYYVY
jgi:hypothetical protein